MKTRRQAANPKHESLYQDLAALVKKHAGKDGTPMEMLAIAANMVGKLIAMQDQRTVTPEMAMGVVAANIAAGNRQVIEELVSKIGGTA